MTATPNVTDRQTTCHGNSGLCIALCGKNEDSDPFYGTSSCKNRPHQKVVCVAAIES